MSNIPWRHCLPLGLILAVLAQASPAQLPIEGTKLQFHLHDGYLVVVRGSLGKLRDLNFVIDTGASRTVVSCEVAERLKLDGPLKKVRSLCWDAEVRQVRLPELQIGAVNRSGIEAWAGAIEFADMDRSERIDGLLGLDVLRETNLSIDYEARTVTFGPVSHSNDPIPFYRGLPIVTVPLMVQGRSVRLLLDTAAKDVLLYESRDLRRFSMSRTGEVKPIRHIGGRFPSERVKILQIALGQSRWKEMSAFLVKGVAREESPDGVLGPSALGLKRLHLDFMRGLISWE